MAADFDAGSIEGSLGLDTSAFRAGMRKAWQEAERFEKRVFRAKLGLDTSEFDRGRRTVTGQVEDLDDQTATPEVEMQGVKSTLASIASVKAALKDLNGEVARTRTTTDTDTDLFGGGGRSRNNGVAAGGFGGFMSGKIGALLLAGGPLASLAYPLGGMAIGGAAGLGGLVSSVASGAISSLLAFQGVGGALEALQKFQDNPSTETFAAMQQAMEGLTEEGRDFTRFIDSSLMPKLEDLQDIAQEGLLPGLQEGLSTASESLFPEVQDWISMSSAATGDLFRSAGNALAGEFWTGFFDWWGKDSSQGISTWGNVFGNFITGGASLFKSLDPLSDSFAQTMLGWSQSFEGWAKGSAGSEQLQEFIEYVQHISPQVADTLSAIAEAALAIVKAMKPYAEVVLPAIEGLADGLTTIANSDAGTTLFGIAAGLVAVNGAIKAYGALRGSAVLTSMLGAPGGRTAAAAGGARKAATGRGGLRGLLPFATGAAAGGLAGRGGAHAARLGGKALLGRAGLIGLAVSIIYPLLKGPLDSLLASTPGEGPADREGSRGLMRFAQDALFGGFNSAKPTPVSKPLSEFDPVKVFQDGLLSETVSKAANANIVSAPLFKRKGGNLDIVADSAREATREVDQLREALSKLGQSVSGRDAMREYQEAVDKFADKINSLQVDVKKNGLLNLSDESTRKAQELFSNVIHSISGAFKGLDKLQKVEFAENVIGQLRDMALKLTGNREDAKKLLTRLHVIDQVKAIANIGLHGVKGVEDEFDVVHKSAKAWDGSIWTSLLKGKPDQAQLALKLLRASAGRWDNSTWNAILDALPAKARKAITDIRGNVWRRWGSTGWDANLTANAKDAYGAITGATSSARDWMHSTFTASLDADASGFYSSLNTAVDTAVNQWQFRNFQAALTTFPTGRGSAMGGIVPGDRTPYKDKVSMLLAPGEYVVSNAQGQVDRFLPLLKSINSGEMNKAVVPNPSGFRSPVQADAGTSDLLAGIENMLVTLASQRPIEVSTSGGAEEIVDMLDHYTRVESRRIGGGR